MLISIGLAGFTGFPGMGVVAGLAFVGDLSVVARVTVNVILDLLQATVRELYIVRTLGVVSIPGLLMTEVVAGRVVLHGPLELVLGVLI